MTDRRTLSILSVFCGVFFYSTVWYWSTTYEVSNVSSNINYTHNWSHPKIELLLFFTFVKQWDKTNFTNSRKCCSYVWINHIWYRSSLSMLSNFCRQEKKIYGNFNANLAKQNDFLNKILEWKCVEIGQLKRWLFVSAKYWKWIIGHS